ncbi:hypothetical protein HYT01_02655 [Candidatus Giovannonibacteria bacterium]|nr:hypothetical protein [Candidatus Giovannonibacteria bacterium]
MLHKIFILLLGALFLNSCGKLSINPAPLLAQENFSSPLNLMSPQITQYRIGGKNEYFWGFLKENKNVLFRLGTIDGFFLEENKRGCLKWRFAIYALGEDKARASVIMINSKVFERRTSFGSGLLSGPMEYGEAEISFFFLYADELLREYNALNYANLRFGKEIFQEDMIWQDFYEREREWTFRKHCREPLEWTKPEMLKKFRPD